MRAVLHARVRECADAVIRVCEAGGERYISNLDAVAVDFEGRILRLRVLRHGECQVDLAGHVGVAGCFGGHLHRVEHVGVVGVFPDAGRTGLRIPLAIAVGLVHYLYPIGIVVDRRIGGTHLRLLVALPVKQVTRVAGQLVVLVVSPFVFLRELDRRRSGYLVGADGVARLVSLVSVGIVGDFAVVVVTPQTGRYIRRRVAVFVELGVFDGLHQTIGGTDALLLDEASGAVVCIFIRSVAFRFPDELVVFVVFVVFLTGKFVSDFAIVVQTILIGVVGNLVPVLIHDGFDVAGQLVVADATAVFVYARVLDGAREFSVIVVEVDHLTHVLRVGNGAHRVAVPGFLGQHAYDRGFRVWVRFGFRWVGVRGWLGFWFWFRCGFQVDFLHLDVGRFNISFGIVRNHVEFHLVVRIEVVETERGGCGV